MLQRRLITEHYRVKNANADRRIQVGVSGVASQDQRIQRRVAECLGDVLMFRGNYDEARLRFDRALELEPDSKARIETKLGELAFKLDDMEIAVSEFERVFERFGHTVPARPVAGAFLPTAHISGIVPSNVCPI